MNLKQIASVALDEYNNEMESDESVFLEDPVVFSGLKDEKKTVKKAVKGKGFAARKARLFQDVKDALDGMKTMRFKITIDTPKYGKTLGIDIPDDSPDARLTGETDDESNAGVSANVDANDEIVEVDAEDDISYSDDVRGFDVGGARQRCATPAAKCRAKNPLTCRYHGLQVFQNDITRILGETYRAAGREFNGSVNVQMMNVTGDGGDQAGVVSLYCDVTVPEGDAELVNRALRTFGNTPGVDVVLENDDDTDVNFDIDFDRLDQNAKAKYRRDDLPEAAEVVVADPDNEHVDRHDVAVEKIVAEGDDPAEIQRQIDDAERRENEAHGELLKANEVVKFLEDAIEKAPDAIKGALGDELNKQREAQRQAVERFKAAEAEGEGLQKKLEEANRLERERAANKAKIEEAQKVVDFAQQMVDNAPDALKAMAQQMLDKAKADLEQIRGGANNVGAQAQVVENEPVGGEHENGEIDDDDEDIEEDVPEPAGKVDDHDPEADERKEAPVAAVNENPEVHEDGPVGPNEPAGDAQAVVTKDQAHQLLVAGKVAVSDANKAKDEVARLRDAGDEEGAKRLEEENIRKLNKGYALSHLTSREGLYKKDENGNLVTTGNDAASRMAAYYQRAYDRAVERHGVEGIANSKGVNGVKDAIAEMCNVLGCKAEFNGRDVKFTWGNGGGHEGPNGGGNGGGDNGGRRENVEAVNAEAQAAHAAVNAAINEAIANNGEMAAAQFNFAANGANVPENLKNLANVQANMAGMPHRFARLDQITPERLKAVIDHLPAGIANHHKDRTIDVLENGRRKRVPVADAIQQMIVNPNGDVGKAMQNRLNQWAAGHAKNSWVERLNQAMGLIHNGADANNNQDVGNGNNDAVMNQEPVVAPAEKDIQEAMAEIRRKEPNFGNQIANAMRELVLADKPNLGLLEQFNVNERQAVELLAERLGENNNVIKYLRQKKNAPRDNQKREAVNHQQNLVNRKQTVKGKGFVLPEEVRAKQVQGAAEDSKKTDQQLFHDIMNFRHEGTPKFITDEARRRGFEVSDKPLYRGDYYDPEGQHINCYKHFASSILNNFGIKTVPIHERSDEEGKRFYKGLIDFYENMDPDSDLTNRFEEMARNEENGTVIYYGGGHANGAILKNGTWYSFDQQAHSIGAKQSPRDMQRFIHLYRRCNKGSGGDYLMLRPVIIRPSDGIAPIIWDMVKRK